MRCFYIQHDQGRVGDQFQSWERAKEMQILLQFSSLYSSLYYWNWWWKILVKLVAVMEMCSRWLCLISTPAKHLRVNGADEAQAGAHWFINFSTVPWSWWRRWTEVIFDTTVATSGRRQFCSWRRNFSRHQCKILRTYWVNADLLHTSVHWECVNVGI